MLDTLRQNAGGWAARILIAFLVMAFAVWGIADIFRGFSADTVITAGDTEIPLERFSLEYQSRLSDLSERIGQPVSADEGRRYGIDHQVVAQLAGGAVLSEEASNLGITVSDAQVAADIRSDESFFGAFGKFDRQTYELILAQNRITEPVFVNDRREFMTRDQLLSSITSGTAVPEGLAQALYNYRYERRTARYLVLPPEIVADQVEEPTDEIVAEYHQQAAIRFTVPETRSFAMLSVNPGDILPTIAIDEALLQQAFEERRDEFDTPERRTVIQLPIADAEEAARTASRLRQGEELETVLSELGLSSDDVTLSEVDRYGFLSPTVADAAFALTEGEISEPVEGPLGPVVLIVTGIQPAIPATFEEKRDELQAELAGVEAADAVFDLYNTIEDERAGGATLREIADRFSFDLVTVEGMTVQGLTVDGPPPADMPSQSGLPALVFENDEGQEIPAEETDEEGYFWVEVTEVVPAAVKPLEEVRDDVIALWKREQGRAKLNELAETLVTRGNAGESIDAIATEYDRAALTSQAMLRRFSNETFSRFGVTNLFATPENKFTSAGAGFGDSLVLMQVTSIETPEPGAGTTDMAEIEEGLATSMSDDLISALVVALQEKHGVEVNYGLIDQLLSPGTGS